MRWSAWADTSTMAIRFNLNLLGDFDPLGGTKYFKPEPSLAIQAAKTTRAFQVLGNFAIYPLWSVSPSDQPEGSTQVELRDERFPFTSVAIVDRSGQVVRSSFQF